MSEPVIEVNGISKRYKINQTSAKHRTFREELARTIRMPIRAMRGTKDPKEDFWALRDVSFTLNEGDVLGIIGRNGSGKSTLLKILTRIVDPTEGKAIMRKRVASLLEVGTGFHPELTGRENIFLNGSVLGMSKKEVNSKFDEIVAFSEIGQFLDTPVKFYSSGMYVRLAFAVAAHLDPEILIIDEVLAVGDAAFQKKCLGFMEDISHKGRTIIFVSHNMGAVRDLCNKGLFLEKGQGTFYEDINDALTTYQVSTAIKNSKKVILAPKDFSGVQFKNFRINTVEIENEPRLFSGDELEVTLDYSNKGSEPYDLCVGFAIRNKRDNSMLTFTHSHLEDVKHKMGIKGKITAKLHIPRLSPDIYTIEANVWLDGTHCVDGEEVGTFWMQPAPAFASRTTPNSFPSYIMINSDWRFDV